MNDDEKNEEQKRISDGFGTEPSDFTIFTHCLKTRVNEIYTDVRSRLPDLSDEATDEHDDDGDADVDNDGNPVPLEIVKSRYWGTDQEEMDRVIASLLSGDLES